MSGRIRSDSGKKQTEPRAAPRPATKPVVLKTLAAATNLSKLDITNLFAAITDLIKNDLGNNGPGVFTLPGLVKVQRYTRTAAPAAVGRNPMTGARITIPARPARTVIRASALKALLEMVA